MHRESKKEEFYTRKAREEGYPARSVYKLKEIEGKAYLRILAFEIDDFLKSRLKLTLHPDKIIIRKYHQGIDFLGYVALPHYRVLRTKTKRRILYKIGSKYRDLQNGAISKKSFKQSL